MDVIVVGAGIGGLTLALTLHRAGIAARIFESAPAIAPLAALGQQPFFDWKPSTQARICSTESGRCRSPPRP